MLNILILFILFIKNLSGILAILCVNLWVLKLFLLFINLYVLYYFCNIPIRKRLKLSTLRQWKNRVTDTYPFKTYLDRLWTTFIIFTYPLIIIGGVLYLRFQNTVKHADLLYYYYEVLYIVKNTTVFNNTLNIVLLISFIFVYLRIFLLIQNIFKFHYTRLHIYYSKNTYFVQQSFRQVIRMNSYERQHYIYNCFVTLFLEYLKIQRVYQFCINIIFHCLNLKIYDKNLDNIETKLSFFNKIEIYCGSTEIKLIYIFDQIKFFIHHILCLLLLFYDIIFNNFILEHIFQILPYVFIYEIWVKITKHVENLHRDYDEYLYHFLYGKITFDWPAYYLGPNRVEISTINAMVKYAENYLFYDWKTIRNKEEKDAQKLRKLYNIRQIPLNIMQLTTVIKSICYFLLFLHISFLLMLITYYIKIHNFG